MFNPPSLTPSPPNWLTDWITHPLPLTSSKLSHASFLGSLKLNRLFPSLVVLKLHVWFKSYVIVKWVVGKGEGCYVENIPDQPKVDGLTPGTQDNSGIYSNSIINQTNGEAMGGGGSHATWGEKKIFDYCVFITANPYPIKSITTGLYCLV